MKKFAILFLFLLLISCKNEQQKPNYNNRIAVLFEKANTNNISKNRIKQLDSIVKLLETNASNDSIKRTQYLKVADSYLGLSDYTKYFRISKNIFVESLLVQDNSAYAQASYNLGNYYNMIAKNDSSYYHYLIAEKQYKKLNDTKNLANTLFQKAKLLYKETDLLGCEIATMSALNLAKKLKNPVLTFECYSYLGYISSEFRNYTSALNYFNKALNTLKNADKIPNKLYYIAKNQFDIGCVYLQTNNYKEANEKFSEGLKYKNSYKTNPVLYAALLNHFAYSAFKIDANNGLEDLLIALKISKNNNDQIGIIKSNIYLTEYFLDKKDTLKALEHNKAAHDFAQKTGNTNAVLRTLNLFTKTQPEKALAYTQMQIELLNNLRAKEHAIQNKLARIEFETGELNTEKETLMNQQKMIVIIFSIIISFGILLYTILYQRTKHRDVVFRQQQQASNEEIYKLMLNNQEEIDQIRKKIKQNIALDLHDNILNRLASTRLNLYAISRRQDEETIKKAIVHIESIRNIEQEIRAFSHELYNDSSYNKSNFKTILEELFRTQKESHPVFCTTKMVYCDAMNDLRPELKMHIYRIIQEAFNNINKHSKATETDLYIAVKNNLLTLQITDNGIGFDLNKKKNGIGLRNMKIRSETMLGEIKINSELGKGTSILLKVKIE